MLHSSFGLRLAVARFVLPAACLLLPLAAQRTEEAFAGASCTSVQRSAMLRTEPGQSGLAWLLTLQAPTTTQGRLVAGY